MYSIGILKGFPPYSPFIRLILTHQRFDQLALVAEQTGDKQQVSQQLGELTANCVACHGAYRLGTITTK